MNKKEFRNFRKQLGKTQRQMAQLLGVSLKAVHSYEQGWRSVPSYVERQIFFLISRRRKDFEDRIPCWVIKNCPSEKKTHCPAWEFNAGDLCWFINGTICDGIVRKKWGEKMAFCRSCDIFKSLL